jgi:hypothetical protein
LERRRDDMTESKQKTENNSAESVTQEQIEKSEKLTREAVKEANKPGASELMKVIAEAQARATKQMKEEAKKQED